MSADQCHLWGLEICLAIEFCPLVDHWETPDSSMSMTNVHVVFLRIKAIALSMHLYGYLRPLDIGIHAPEFPGSVDILGICDQYPVPSGDVET